MTASENTTGMARDGWGIRRAGAHDVEALHAMLAEMSEELGAGEVFHCDADALLRHGFGAAPIFRALLAERAGEALGMALYFPEFSTLRGRPGAYVQDLFVRPGARVKRLGRRLLGAVARDAAEAWGAAYLRLCAHEANPRALAFYARLGFRTDRGERPLWIEGEAFDKLGDTT